MKLYNEYFAEISENEVDLALGEIVIGTIIRKDAAPIDNVTKFAWNDDDYENVRIYRKFTEAELDASEANPENVEARITALEKELAAAKILLGVE